MGAGASVPSPLPESEEAAKAAGFTEEQIAAYKAEQAAPVEAAAPAEEAPAAEEAAPAAPAEEAAAPADGETGEEDKVGVWSCALGAVAMKMSL